MLLPPFWRCCLILLTHQEKGKLAGWECYANMAGTLGRLGLSKNYSRGIDGASEHEGVCYWQNRDLKFYLFSVIKFHVHYSYSGTWKLLWSDPIFFRIPRSVIYARKIFDLFIGKRKLYCFTGLRCASVTDPMGGLRLLSPHTVSPLSSSVLGTTSDMLVFTQDNPKKLIGAKDFLYLWAARIIFFSVMPCSFLA